MTVQKNIDVAISRLIDYRSTGSKDAYDLARLALIEAQRKIEEVVSYIDSDGGIDLSEMMPGRIIRDMLGD